MAYKGKFRNKMRVLKVFKITQEYIERNGNEYHAHIYLQREIEEIKIVITGFFPEHVKSPCFCKTVHRSLIIT